MTVRILADDKVIARVVANGYRAYVATVPARVSREPRVQVG